MPISVVFLGYNVLKTTACFRLEKYYTLDAEVTFGGSFGSALFQGVFLCILARRIDCNRSGPPQHVRSHTICKKKGKISPFFAFS